MKDYRRILEIAADASEEQIKAQYKRLVRIYHPDRFTNPDDKVYVEQKLQEINEAYRALLHPAFNAFVTDYTGPQPQPIALPASLDFGELARGKQQTLVFHVENSGGVAQSLQLEYSDVDGWFKVTKGRRLHPHQPFPMEFAVVVDTARLEAGKSYQGWIQVNLDNAVTRVALAVKVVAKQPLSLLSPRLALLTSMIALLVIVVAVQAFDFTSVDFFLNRPFRSPRTAALGPVLVPDQPAALVTSPSDSPALAVLPIVPSATVETFATVIIQPRSGLGSIETQTSPAADPVPATIELTTAPMLTATAQPMDSSSSFTGVQSAVGVNMATVETVTMSTPTLLPMATSLPRSTLTPSVPTPTRAPSVNTVDIAAILILVPDNYYVNGRADTLVESPVLQILPSGSQWVAIGRTADTSWLLLEVEKEQLVWVATTTVIATSDVATLPIVSTAVGSER